MNEREKDTRALYESMMRNDYLRGDSREWEVFQEKMLDKANRKRLYDWVSQRHNIGSYEDYERRLAPASEASDPEPEVPNSPLMNGPHRYYHAETRGYPTSTARQNYEKRRDEFDESARTKSQSSLYLNNRFIPVVADKQGNYIIPYPIKLSLKEELYRHGKPSLEEQREYHNIIHKYNSPGYMDRFLVHGEMIGYVLLLFTMCITLVKFKKQMDMKKLLQCLGTVIYSIVTGYLLWLLFYRITPYIMGVGWLLFFLYIFLVGGLITGIVAFVNNSLIIPMVFLMKNNIAAKVINVFPLLFFGYSSVRLSWELDMNYGVLQYLIGISLTITVLISFGSMIIAPFKLEDDIKTYSNSKK